MSALTPTPFLDVAAEEVLALLTRHGGKASQLKQIHSQVFRSKAQCWEEMGLLPAVLGDALAERYTLHPLTLDRTDISALDGTMRYLSLIHI